MLYKLQLFYFFLKVYRDLSWVLVNLFGHFVELFDPPKTFFLFVCACVCMCTRAREMGFHGLLSWADLILFHAFSFSSFLSSVRKCNYIPLSNDATTSWKMTLIYKAPFSLLCILLFVSLFT